MTCCTYKCEQGRDCPIRKQSIEAANKAFIERGRVADTDPYIDTLGTVKALISVIVVCVIVTLIFFFWGK
jgi:hypothetical protein